jgi:hypothetical protein
MPALAPFSASFEPSVEIRMFLNIGPPFVARS